MEITVADYVSGGYTVSAWRDEVDWTGTRLRRWSLAEDHSSRTFFPDAWAIDWVEESRAQRLESARRIGLTEERLDEAVAWATAQIDAAFGGWSAVFTLATAREVASRFFGSPPDILGLGLHRDLVAGFVRAVTPPNPEPGYAPWAGAGCLRAVQRGDSVASGGVPLGFEILGIDKIIPGMSILDSLESRHEDEIAIRAEIGIETNEHDLVTDFADAVRFAEAAAGIMPDLHWCPWLLTRYEV